jgi:drug/metabolite transporter (DMT)-like permease
MKKGILFCVAAAVLFGLVPPVLKCLLINGVSTTSALLGPNLFLFTGTLALCAVKREKLALPLRPAILLLVTGAVGMGATNLFLTSSYSYIAAGTATVLNFLYPTIVTVYSIAVMGKKATFAALAAVVCSIIGMICISLNGGSDDGLNGGPMIWGFLLALASAFTYSLFIIGSKLFKPQSLSDEGTLCYMAGGAVIMALSWAMMGHSVVLPDKLWLWGIYGLSCVMVGTGLALLDFGIDSVGPVSASFATLLEPVTAVVCSAVFYGEQITFLSAVGFILILLSVWLNAR